MNKKVRIAMIGGGFMGRMHSLAYRVIPHLAGDLSFIPVRELVVEKTEELAKKVKNQYGFNRFSNDWLEAVEDPSIDVVDIVTPNHLHAEIALAAIKAKKHVLCEKPLARNIQEAYPVYKAARESNKRLGVNFCYRRVPAVTFAQELIQKGIIGKIYHCRFFFSTDFFADPLAPISWRRKRSIAGAGALNDLGPHIIDLARFLVGEIEEVVGYEKTMVNKRPILKSDVSFFDFERASKKTEMVKVDTEDMGGCLARFANGALGIVECTFVSYGHKLQIYFEIFGSKGSVMFNYDQMNSLTVCLPEGPDNLRGNKTIHIGGPIHPYGKLWWPVAGLNVGYDAGITNTLLDFLNDLKRETQKTPSFYDGFRTVEICDSIEKSSKSKTWVKCAPKNNRNL